MSLVMTPCSSLSASAPTTRTTPRSASTAIFAPVDGLVMRSLAIPGNPWRSLAIPGAGNRQVSRDKLQQAPGRARAARSARATRGKRRCPNRQACAPHRLWSACPWGGGNSRPLAERMPHPVGADDDAPVRVGAGQSHLLHCGRAHETEQLDLLRRAQLSERQLGEIGPYVEAIVLDIRSERQHHIACVQDLSQRRQNLASLAIPGDLLPVLDGVANRRDAKVGFELVELPGVPQILD